MYLQINIQYWLLYSYPELDIYVDVYYFIN